MATTDAAGGVDSQVGRVVAAEAVTHAQALWAEELAHALEAAPRLGLTARGMVRAVLASLAGDATIDPVSRRDARAALEAIDRLDEAAREAA